MFLRIFGIFFTHENPGPGDNPPSICNQVFVTRGHKHHSQSAVFTYKGN